MKTLSLIVRKRKTEKGSFNSFSTKVGELWYTVKFTQDCLPPAVFTIGGNRQRAFIKLDDGCSFDVKKAEKDTDFNALYVSNYIDLRSDEIDAAIKAEELLIKDFEDKRRDARISFLADI